MSFIKFSKDEQGLSLFHVDDPKYRALGAWIITDISVYMQVALDALAMIDDVSKGDEPFEPWSSEHYDVAFSRQGLKFRNQYVETEEGEYSLAEAREAIEEYWRFLSSQPENPHLEREYRPDLPQWQADLLQWEEVWERTHPYRGRLF